MPNVERVVGRILVVPKFPRRSGVDSPDVVRRGDIEDPVHQNRRRLDLLILARLEAPDLLKFCDIFRRNLGEAGMPLAGVTAVIVEPAICGRVEQGLGVDALRRRH